MRANRARSSEHRPRSTVLRARVLSVRLALQPEVAGTALATKMAALAGILRLMAVSAEHRRKFDQQVEALRSFEEPADAQITGAERASAVAAENERRRLAGKADIVNDEEEYPELGFHRLAAARGMVTRRR